ncbi:MAG: hypothetical protein CO187_00860 [Zetaproteobacteria bacterium CG_4_9_14_3_um_filter_53_7]|nr:MAG: hypothetical protein CO187_00860 [Zetaproteobacteria bacterium CG_4_9_14_3_um_filter_53_7]
MYFQMCAKSLIHYRHLCEKLPEFDNLDPRYNVLMSSVKEASVQPVIFAGMCLEATLYDLAACLFGDEFAQNTDKLDPLGKFVMLAQCINHETPSKSHIAYQSIKALITARNRLIHYKSQPLELEFKLIRQSIKLHTKHMLGITNSFRSLVLLSLYFNGNVFEELRILPSFKETEHWSNIVPIELHNEVNHCIKLSKRTQES